VKSSISSKNLASYFLILNHLGLTFFFLVNQVCPFDVHRYPIIYIVWVLVFELMAIKNISLSCR